MAVAGRTLLALGLLLASALSAPSAPCSKCPASTQTGENSTAPAAAADQQQAPAGQPGIAAAGAAHPMAAYLALRPVLPAKPTFLPPFVDPNAFVDKKAALLSNLFGAPGPVPAYAPAASQYYAPAPAYASAPYAPAPYAPAPFSPPNFFAAKKTSFLGSLFNTLQQPPAATPPQAKRAAVPPPAGTSFVDPAAFAAKKTAFLKKLFETLNATAAPDAADEPDTAPEPLPTVPLTGPTTVDPTVFAAKKTAFLSALFDSLGLPPPTPAAPAGIPPFWSTYFPAGAAAPAPTPKPTIVPPGFWSPFAPAPAGAPAAFPPVKPTIVPPGFWIPPGKPTPPASPYKAKVAVFLDKLFNSFNATDAPSSAARRNVDDSSAGEDETNNEISAEDNRSSRSRRFVGPPFAVPPFADPAPAQPFAPFGPFGGLKPFGPGGPYGPGGPFGKPFVGGPFAGAKPFAPFAPFAPAAPVVDPKVFLDKKTTFLGQLFASKAAASAAPPASAADAVAAPDFWANFGVPTPKPTIVPPGFWSPFGASPAAAPTAKPTIVPPGFWSPYAAPAAAPAAPAAPAPAMLDKKTAFLQKLYSTLNTTPAPPAPEPQPEIPEATVGDEDFDAFLAALAEVVAAPGPAKRSLGAAPATPELARQQLLDNVVAQMATLKDDMVGTVDQILKTKASAAAAQPPFPFAKPFAAYGAAKKGPGAAAGKKSGPPPFVGKKAGPPPFVGAGGAPFWGAAEPTPDPTLPLQQRLKMLSQAFDSLAAIEKDASAAVQAAAADSATPAPAPAPNPDTAALLEYLRAAAAAPPARKSKAGKLGKERSVHFAVRQGQLSLPPGAEELLTAGGGANGASDDAHEGGGLRLQIKVPA